MPRIPARKPDLKLRINQAKKNNNFIPKNNLEKLTSQN